MHLYGHRKSEILRKTAFNLGTVFFVDDIDFHLLVGVKHNCVAVKGGNGESAEPEIYGSIVHDIAHRRPDRIPYPVDGVKISHRDIPFCISSHRQGWIRQAPPIYVIYNIISYFLRTFKG